MALTPEEEERLWHAVFGNGKTGLAEEVRLMQNTLYKNARTGEQGLIADVRDIKKMVIQIRTGWWIIGAIVLLAQFLQLIGVVSK